MPPQRLLTFRLSVLSNESFWLISVLMRFCIHQSEVGLKFGLNMSLYTLMRVYLPPGCYMARIYLEF
jgi:hypothetical protein